MFDQAQLRKGTLEGCILKIIDREPTYGYAIATTLRDCGFADLTEGTLYPLLHSLEEKELIISYEKDEYAARPRRYYHLARKGRALLREKEEEWTEFTAAVDRVLRGGGCLGSA